MKKCGFTLVEVLAVLVLVGALAIISVPSILNYINQSKGEISETTEKLIYAGVDLYVDNNILKFKENLLQQYCVSLNDVVEANYLQAPIIDSVSGEELDLNKYVRINYYYDKNLKVNQVSYQLTSECEQKKYICASLDYENAASGNYEYGDEYICEMGDGIERKFYLLDYKKGDETLDLILDRNLGAQVIWGSNGLSTPSDAWTQLMIETGNWRAVDIANIKFPTAQQLANTQGKTFSQQAMPLPKWLSTNLDGDQWTELPGGYWTSTPDDTDYRFAWAAGGFLSREFKNSTIIDPPEYYMGPNETLYIVDIGVRPVVTVNKTEIYNYDKGGNYEK